MSADYDILALIGAALEKKKHNAVVSVCASFCMALTLLFISCKVGEIIDWSWWWVFSPIWIAGFLIMIFVYLADFVDGGVALLRFLKACYCKSKGE